jgi:hypothetical protein
MEGYPLVPFLFVDGNDSQSSQTIQTLITFGMGIPYAKHNIPIHLLGEDIIPVVIFTWEKTFGNARTNKKSITVRGNYPLNRSILLYKEICSGTTTYISEPEPNEMEKQQSNSTHIIDGTQSSNYIDNLPSLLNRLPVIKFFNMYFDREELKSF